MGGGFICLGKIEIGFLKGRLVFKTRHFVNWRCCGENFFSFLFFLLLDTLSQKNINAAIKSASGRRTTITFTPRYFYVITQ